MLYVRALYVDEREWLRSSLLDGASDTRQSPFLFYCTLYPKRTCYTNPFRALGFGKRVLNMVNFLVFRLLCNVHVYKVVGHRVLCSANDPFIVYST